MNTVFLATVMGWYLVITSVFLLARYDYARSVMADVMAQRGLLFTLAIITLVIGLLLVVTHNVWFMSWPVVITILSWLILIGGLIRLFCPESAIRMGQALLDDPIKMRVAAIIFLLIGLYLLMKVYYPVF